jgi:DNA-directed RNA polymerase specialized sigma subunit
MTAATPPSTIISREEKEKHVLELYYNQGMNMRDIAKEMKMSFSTIGDIIERDKQQKAIGRERERNNSS